MKLKTCLEGFEPPTLGLEVRCSIQLSYRHTAGDGNRTHVAGLEGQNSTIELHPQKALEKLIGAEGFEPPTPWSQTTCATKLRYAPTTISILPQVKEPVKKKFFGVTITNNWMKKEMHRGGGIRTPDPMVPNHVRYQTALRPDDD